MAAVVEIDETTWFVFAAAALAYFILLGTYGFTKAGLAWAWVAFGWCFHIFSVMFEKVRVYV